MFMNSLCSDEDCRLHNRCQHIGPRGDFCNYELEKRLCAMLGRTWVQQLDRESLLAEIEQRLDGDRLTEKIAERMQPSPATSWSPPSKALSALHSPPAPKLEDDSA